jgi:hypothetical protein
MLADPLYLTHYIEKAGSGTLDIIALCLKAELPEPDFRQDGGQFVVTLWRDWITDKVLDQIDLNERQKKAIVHIKLSGKITNREYQKLTSAMVRTAARDLDDLVQNNIIKKVGSTGRNAHYILQKKQVINRTQKSPKSLGDPKQDINRTNRTSEKKVGTGFAKSSKKSLRIATSNKPLKSSKTLKTNSAKKSPKRLHKKNGKKQ